jgi:hypothetical protein
MRLAIDPTKPLPNYTDHNLLRAATQLYIARAHGDLDFQLDRVSKGSHRTISEIGDALVGKAGDLTADFGFEVHEHRADDNLSTARVYHAACQLYASDQYCWNDFEDDCERAVERGDVIADLVDETAADFDISGVDDWTRRGLRESGFLAPVEDAPAPRM